MARLRALYGTGPLHLLAVTGSLALTLYIAAKFADSADRWELLAWFAGAIVLHDLVLFPVYTALDRLARGRIPSGAINHVRVPVLLSLLLLLMWAGLVLERAPGTYEAATGLRPDPYLERWLAITAVLLLGSALLYALRARRAAPD